MPTIPSLGVLQLRNELAFYLHRNLSFVDCGDDTQKLPPPINNRRACESCPQLLNCSLFQKWLPCYTCNSCSSFLVATVRINVIFSLFQMQRATAFARTGPLHDYFGSWNFVPFKCSTFRVFQALGTICLFGVASKF